MGFWIESPTLAAAISDALDRGAASTAWQVGLAPDGTLTWTGQDGTPTGEEPGTGAIKRAMLALLAWLPVEWMM